ncbi:TPA: twin-arginine translocase TatA/TatE family subunit [Pseudomonas aeruginosa]|jgi:sec-independent protein translocase protein TatA|uniref:twin-arginine translocase TatA/TatE family subunit n=1 Tax=Pseudomonadaceae TaxID=135621 RepID=UPI0018C73BAB|nr:twin-arginine translocase TatA/TatE family subunit [Pseudomonas aeruginosa]MBG4378399.1 twin-arginine translocase TatA/TatE family subunit [Pseudomonas aeruginosa]MBI8227226.1 twin-arginine translocase TatA/TatE family subunit [Pseudomonas aeruginosa]MCT5070595.1 twin-arginine translocase TatA/TatE family subunit [Pseudomonas aeruginosa]MDP5707309.1 twin-arginine translocase TatA/TatE family subunit [Pseudomonas aeruginosa]HBO0353805.1 twin-arginine translocase TatA/TatE family subunit [Pse
MGIFDWKHWLVLLLVVLVLFGGKRLKGLGADLGESIKGFRRSMAPDPELAANAEPPAQVAVESNAEQMARGAGSPQK